MRRFTIKNLLLITAAIAVVLVAYPRVLHYWKWNEVRNNLEQWSSNLKRENGRVESYVYVDTKFAASPGAANASAPRYCVLTGEPSKMPDLFGNINWSVHSGTKVDPKRFYVIPPGKWVENIDEVVQAWEEHSKLVPSH